MPNTGIIAAGVSFRDHEGVVIKDNTMIAEIISMAKPRQIKTASLAKVAHAEKVKHQDYKMSKDAVTFKKDGNTLLVLKSKSGRRIKPSERFGRIGNLNFSDLTSEAVTSHAGSLQTRTGEGNFGKIVDLSTVGTYFDYWARATGDGKVIKVETYQNYDSGKMGGFVHINNQDPGNNDVIEGHAESGFCWWHVPSRDCRLAVNAVVVQTYARYKRQLYDQDFQISNCSIQQENLLTAGYFYNIPNNFGKATRDVGPSSFYSGDGSHSQDNSGGPYSTDGIAVGYPDIDILSRVDGATNILGLALDVPLQKDRAVLCFIGARSQIYGTLDDVTADVWQGGTWKLINLGVTEV